MKERFLSTLKKMHKFYDFSPSEICIKRIYNLRSSSLQFFFTYFLSFIAVWFSCEMQLTNSILIFFNKDNFNRKTSLWFQRCQCILELTNSGNKLIIMSIYVLTLECRKTDQDTFDVLYNKLESVIKNVKSRDSPVIAGDFNVKVGNNTPESKQKTDWNIRKRKSK